MSGVKGLLQSKVWVAVVWIHPENRELLRPFLGSLLSLLWIWAGISKWLLAMLEKQMSNIFPLILNNCLLGCLSWDACVPAWYNLFPNFCIHLLTRRAVCIWDNTCREYLFRSDCMFGFSHAQDLLSFSEALHACLTNWFQVTVCSVLTLNPLI